MYIYNTVQPVIALFLKNAMQGKAEKQMEESNQIELCLWEVR